MSERVVIGFEVDTDQQVTIPFHHAGVVGMTGKAGKSTAIDAVSARAVPFGYRIIGFITKRGEQAFSTAKRLPLFFRERSDWQYVESLLEAKITEDQRYNRAWIIKACRGAGTLREVWNNVRHLKEKSRKDSLSERVYTVLDAYFELVIPEIERYEFSSTLDIQEETNYVLDLERMPLAVQAVIIRSVLEEVYQNWEKTIVIVPEAWKFIGTTHTPVTAVAIAIIREGYAVKVFLWCDSQDIASINPKIRGQIDNWILGRQRYEHEIDRTLRAMPTREKPTREQIKTLKLGHFYVACEDWLKHVYVWALGVPESVAKAVAKGDLKPEYVKDNYLKKIRKKGDEEEMYKELLEEEKRKHKETKTELADLKEKFEKLQSIEPSETVKDLKEQLEQAGKQVEDMNKEMLKLEKATKKFEENVQELTKKETERAKQLEAAHEELKKFEVFKKALADLMPQQKIAAEPTKSHQVKNLTVESPLKQITVEDPTPKEVILSADMSSGKVMFCAIEMSKKQDTFTNIDMRTIGKEHAISLSNIVFNRSLGYLVKEGYLIREGDNYRLPKNVPIKVVKAE